MPVSRKQIANALLKVAKEISAAVRLNFSSRTRDGWIKGTARAGGKEYVFQNKQFDDAVNGIDGGRIVKLWLSTSNSFRDTILNYDRGWERSFSPRGKSGVVAEIYKELLKKFN